MSPTPFSLHVPDEAIDDLRARLARARLPDPAPGEPWTAGADVAWMEKLASYWREGFDWRAQEARLNAFPQFKARIDGLDIHFIAAPGKGPKPIPLLLAHGWPGSVFEFLDLIPRLTDPASFGGDPADAVTVIAPSLPGFGLSHAPGRRFGGAAMAELLARLMTEVLGHDRYALQGGDWGAFTTARIAYDHPDRVIGLHLNFLTLRRDLAIENPTPEEAAYLDALAAFVREETGYQQIQGTKPQTLAFGLTDSPTGLAAWIAEKFRAWSDCGGDVERAIPLDGLLANISLYWFTGAIAAPFWPYYERAQGAWPIPGDRPVTVPMGYAAFPKEIIRPPRSLAETMFADIRRWTETPRGGHFAAMEQPSLLAEDVLAFLRPLR